MYLDASQFVTIVLCIIMYLDASQLQKCCSITKPISNISVSSKWQLSAKHVYKQICILKALESWGFYPFGAL